MAVTGRSVPCHVRSFTTGVETLNPTTEKSPDMNPREDAVSEFLMDLEVAMMRLSDRLTAIELHPSNQEPTCDPVEERRG